MDSSLIPTCVMWSIGSILTMYDFPATKSMELLLTLKYFSHWLTLTEADPRRHGLSAASPLYDLMEFDLDVILKIRNMNSRNIPVPNINPECFFIDFARPFDFFWPDSFPVVKGHGQFFNTWCGSERGPHCVTI